MDKDSNVTTTLKSYEENTAKYIEGTEKKVTGELKEYLDTVAGLVNKNAEILEIGSASGRDADYLESEGYKVTRTDAVEGFIELQKTKGHEVEKFNVLYDDLKNKFDLIIATAVFLHFTLEQFVKAVQNCRKHLKTNGYLAISLKLGNQEFYSEHKLDSKRYFKEWHKEELIKVIEDQNMVVEKIIISSDKKWITAIAKL